MYKDTTNNIYKELNHNKLNTNQRDSTPRSTFTKLRENYVLESLSRCSHIAGLKGNFRTLLNAYKKVRRHVNPNNYDFDTNHLATLIFKENSWNLKKVLTLLADESRDIIKGYFQL